MKNVARHTPAPTSTFSSLIKGAKLTVGVAWIAALLHIGHVREKISDILSHKDPASVVVPPITHEGGEKIVPPLTYHVKKGDTLSQIAHRHGITLQNILEINEWIDPHKLKIGQKILVPQTKKAPPHMKEERKNVEIDPASMKKLTMVFEGFNPRMQIDTQNKENNNVTYVIGYGTNVGTRTDEYPYASRAKDVAHYLEEQGYTSSEIWEIMQGTRAISRAEALYLFTLRYNSRLAKFPKICGENWDTYPPIIQSMLIDMSYNMGEYSIFPHGNSKWFPDAVDALNRGDWAGFLNAVVDSKYANDVGDRRLGTWIAVVVRYVLHDDISWLSPESLKMYQGYATKHWQDITTQISKID